MKRLTVLALVAAAGLVGAPARGSAAPAQSTALAGSYTLVDTWQNVPWELRPGHYGSATDISSGPDGTTYVLDSRHDAVHVVGQDGTATAVFRLNPNGLRWAPAVALDVGFDGTLHVLRVRQARRDSESRIERFRADGSPIGSWSGFGAYGDLAVRRDGRVYLVGISDQSGGGSPALDVYADTGVWLESIWFPELAAPIRVDVASNDVIYVLQEVPPPPAERPPGPLPTPGPSAALQPLFPNQEVDPVAGVVIIAPDHTYIETVPLDYGTDVAVGQAGVFVSRYGEVLALRAIDPLTPPAVQEWSGDITLDVNVDGSVRGGLRHCAFEAVLAYGAPVAAPAQATLHGVLDRPALEGPVYPLRLAADDDAALLQGRFRTSGERPNQSYDTAASEPAVVQRWDPSGTPSVQLGICLTGSPAGARDVGVADGDIVLVDNKCVEFRPTSSFPAWTQCLDGVWPDATSYLTAVAMDATQIAVLDGGANGVVFLDRAGAVVHKWRVEAGSPSAPLGDIALGAGIVALADPGRSRVLLRTPDGQPVADWAVHDSPRNLDIGPDGTVYVLGGTRWGLTYEQDGTLTAAWRLPDNGAEPTDIAVGADGRVLISFVRLGGSPGFPSPTVRPILEAGVWVFEPSASDAPQIPNRDGCAATPDKTAAPGRIPLGAEVTVELQVHGACPGDPVPVQFVIVMDTSRSMTWGYALDEAKVLVLALLRSLNPAQHEVGLVTFDDDAALRVSLTRDLVSVATEVASLRTGADTRMVSGLEAALRQLEGPLPAPDARRVILLVTDGNPTDNPWEAFNRARSLDIEVDALFVETGQLADPIFETSIMGAVMRGTAESEIARYAATLTSHRAEPGLFRIVTITDELPTNMTFVEGSAEPPVQVAGRTLTWQLSDVVAATGVSLSYRVRPQEVGTWPTNVRADAAYQDARGFDGSLVFPVPRVEVVAPLAPIYLPFAARYQCFRKDRPTDVVLVVDVSSSMGEAAVGGGTKLDAAKVAAAQFLDLLRLPSDRAGLVAFSDRAVVASGLTGDRAELSTALAALATGPGTQIDSGLAAAAEVLADRRAEARPVVVLLTDGRHGGDPEDVVARAETLRSTEVLMYAIGLGADVDMELLGVVAGASDRLFVSPTESDLARIYGEVSERLACDVR